MAHKSEMKIKGQNAKRPPYDLGQLKLETRLPNLQVCVIYLWVIRIDKIDHFHFCQLELTKHGFMIHAPHTHTHTHTYIYSLTLNFLPTK